MRDGEPSEYVQFVATNLDHTQAATETSSPLFMQTLLLPRPKNVKKSYT